MAETFRTFVQELVLDEKHLAGAFPGPPLCYTKKTLVLEIGTALDPTSLGLRGCPVHVTAVPRAAFL